MSDNNIFSDFMAIFTAWDTGKSNDIVFDLIINWLTLYRNIIAYTYVIDNLFIRIKNIDGIATEDFVENFVEDFIYDEIYLCLRITYYKRS